MKSTFQLIFALFLLSSAGSGTASDIQVLGPGVYCTPCKTGVVGEQMCSVGPPGEDPGLWDPSEEHSYRAQLMCRFPTRKIFESTRREATDALETSIQSYATAVSNLEQKRIAVANGSDKDAREIPAAQRERAIAALRQGIDGQRRLLQITRDEHSRLTTEFARFEATLSKLWRRSY